MSNNLREKIAVMTQFDIIKINKRVFVWIFIY